MKKILVIVNDHEHSENVLKLAIEIAAKEKATLFGLFIGSTEGNSPGTEGGNENPRSGKFIDKCTAAGVACKTHKWYADAIADHSAFSDLLVCSADADAFEYSVTGLIGSARCPVLLVNEDYQQVESIIFTYDDKSSSIHAIKYFTYLFTLYNDLPVRFVSVVPKNVIGMEYDDMIREWLPLHYPNAEVIVLKGDPKEELTGFINAHANSLVIMGAFGRSSLSRFFKESLANIILEKTNAPIFIAHD